MDGAIIKDAKRLGRSRVDDDFTDDVARLGPDHSDRVSGAWIWEADPEVVVDGEISIGSFGRWARSRRAIGARLEELEDGMSGVPKLTWLDGDRLDEHSPVSQQGGPVAREALVVSTCVIRATQYSVVFISGFPPTWVTSNATPTGGELPPGAAKGGMNRRATRPADRTTATMRTAQMATRVRSTGPNRPSGPKRVANSLSYAHLPDPII